MNKNKLPLLLILGIAAISISSCGDKKGWVDGSFSQFKKSVLIREKDVVLEDNDFHTAKQRAYIDGTWDNINEFARGMKELSIPRGIKLQLPKNSTTIQFSSEKNFSICKNLTFEENTEPVVHNLLSGKTYYYKAVGENITDATVYNVTVTNALPRNLYVDGVTNVRDIGGYKSKLGGHIKQNKFIRGGRLTRGHDQPESVVTDKGLSTLVNELRIKTEIDLRNNASTDPSRPENGNMNNDFFSNIEYINIPMNYSAGENVLLQKEQMKKVFDVLSNKANYPVYVHCTIGTDRTGAVSYLLGALLGMDNESLHTDYLFSNFGDIGRNRTIYDIENNYYDTLRAYKKNTLQKCAEAYLLDIGITKNQIKTIKNIMLEK